MQDCHEPIRQNVFEITSSPSDAEANTEADPDMAIVNVTPAQRETGVIYDDDLEDDSANPPPPPAHDSDDDIQVLHEIRRINPSRNAAEVEITNVEQVRRFHPLSEYFDVLFDRPSSAGGEQTDPARSNRLPPRSFAQIHPSNNNNNNTGTRSTRPRRQRPTPPISIAAIHDNLEAYAAARRSLFSQINSHARHHHFSSPAYEHAQLEWAIFTSTELYASGGASPGPPAEVKTIPVPTDVKEGCTRSVDPSKVYLCAWCQCEYNVGIPAKPPIEADTHDETEDWQKRYGGASEVEFDLSKRVFFAPCCHVYCGWCVKRIINRPKGKKGKRPRRASNLANHAYIARCCVKGCQKAFRGKFIELYC